MADRWQWGKLCLNNAVYSAETCKMPLIGTIWTRNISQRIKCWHYSVECVRLYNICILTKDLAVDDGSIRQRIPSQAVKMMFIGKIQPRFSVDKPTKNSPHLSRPIRQEKRMILYPGLTEISSQGKLRGSSKNPCKVLIFILGTLWSQTMENLSLWTLDLLAKHGLKFTVVRKHWSSRYSGHMKDVELW